MSRFDKTSCSQCSGECGYIARLDDTKGETMTEDDIDVGPIARARRDLVRQNPLTMESEYRLHPEDFDELVRQSVSLVEQPWDRPERIFGLRIVVDPDAPRLPRKLAKDVQRQAEAVQVVGDKLARQ
jgi:hypothetical protein